MIPEETIQRFENAALRESVEALNLPEVQEGRVANLVETRRGASPAA